AQLLAQRERVDGGAAIEEREHRLVERAMRLRVEVGGAQHLDHARQRLAPLEQDGAEDGALGIQVVRRNARRNFERHAASSAGRPHGVNKIAPPRPALWAASGQGVNRGPSTVGNRCTEMKTPGGIARGLRPHRAGCGYSRTTLTRSCAVTSACSRIGTVVSPSVLIGSSRWTRRRSTATPCLPRKSTRSWDVTEPNSLPSSDACRRSS